MISFWGRSLKVTVVRYGKEFQCLGSIQHPSLWVAAAFPSGLMGSGREPNLHGIQRTEMPGALLGIRHRYTRCSRMWKQIFLWLAWTTLSLHYLKSENTDMILLSAIHVSPHEQPNKTKTSLSVIRWQGAVPSSKTQNSCSSYISHTG